MITSHDIHMYDVIPVMSALFTLVTCTDCNIHMLNRDRMDSIFKVSIVHNLITIISMMGWLDHCYCSCSDNMYVYPSHSVLYCDTLLYSMYSV